jgi:hypothetical protein
VVKVTNGVVGMGVTMVFLMEKAVVLVLVVVDCPSPQAPIR